MAKSLNYLNQNCSVTNRHEIEHYQNAIYAMNIDGVLLVIYK